MMLFRVRMMFGGHKKTASEDGNASSEEVAALREEVTRLRESAAQDEAEAPKADMN